MKRSTKITTFAGIGIIAVFVFALALAAHTSLHDLSFREQTFESTHWKTGDLRDRGEMVASLQRQHQRLLEGKSRDAVLDLLGQPDEDYPYQVRYRVDVGRRIAWKPFAEILILSIDEDNGVYQVVRVD